MILISRCMYISMENKFQYINEIDITVCEKRDIDLYNLLLSQDQN